MLPHETLDVYRCAIDFLAFATRLVEALPPGYEILTAQLRRAAISIPANIAESAVCRTAAERRRFLAVARGSAMECGAVLDVCRVLRLDRRCPVGEGKELLARIVGMLTKMRM